jgi:hypothetical protein
MTDQSIEDASRSEFDTYFKATFINKNASQSDIAFEFYKRGLAARQSISQSEPIAYNHYFKYSDGELEQVLSHQETVPVIQGLVYTGKTEKLGVIS